ncbi:MAG: CUB domain-containing protein [Bacteroidia bacterium]
MKPLIALLLGFACAQTYTHPTTGLLNTYSGGCPIHTCSGTYYDNGGSSNYSNNINSIYQTFCPNQQGRCLRVTFSSFNVENGCFWGSPCRFSGDPCCYDILRVINGPNQYGTELWKGCGNAIPGPFTSTDASGCLTFRFCSDGSNQRSGWAATFSCVNCAANSSSGNSDCGGATQICSNGSFSDPTVGPGIAQENICGSNPAQTCISSLNYTNWYYVCFNSGGTWQMSICPSGVSDADIDFAIWGPFNSGTHPTLSAVCNAISAATLIRCSYVWYCFDCALCTHCGPDPCNFLTNTASDNIEQVDAISTPGRLAPITVPNPPAGTTNCYLLMINGWTPGTYTFNFNFSGTTAQISCTPLSFALAAFEATSTSQGIWLTWKKALEDTLGADAWILERKVGDAYQLIAEVPVSLTSFLDDKPMIGLNTYRLSARRLGGEVEAFPLERSAEWYPAYQPVEFTLYRTPEGYAELNISPSLPEEAILSLYSLDGRFLGESRLPPFLSRQGMDLPAGYYIVRLQLISGYQMQKAIALP